MVRPDGFEPPTPRFVVGSNPQSDKPAWGKRLERKAFPSFHFISVWLISSQYGNNDGNKFQSQKIFHCANSRFPEPSSWRKKPRISWCISSARSSIGWSWGSFMPATKEIARNQRNNPKRCWSRCWCTGMPPESSEPPLARNLYRM